MAAIDRTLLMHGPLASLGCPNLSMKIWSVSAWQARCGHTGALMDKNINFTATQNHSVRKTTVLRINYYVHTGTSRDLVLYCTSST